MQRQRLSCFLNKILYLSLTKITDVTPRFSEFCLRKKLYFVKRQALSYSLLFLFLFGALVPGQTQEELTRLPVLWKHYQIHKSQSPTSFLEYLALHYGKDFAQHSTAHDHSKLPMKSGDNHLHLPSPTDLPKPIMVSFQALSFLKTTPSFKDHTYSFLLLYDIWQPPKFC